MPPFRINYKCLFRALQDEINLLLVLTNNIHKNYFPRTLYRVKIYRILLHCLKLQYFLPIIIFALLITTHSLSVSTQVLRAEEPSFRS